VFAAVGMHNDAQDEETGLLQPMLLKLRMYNANHPIMRFSEEIEQGSCINGVRHGGNQAMPSAMLCIGIIAAVIEKWRFVAFFKFKHFTHKNNVIDAFIFESRSAQKTSSTPLQQRNFGRIE
jgi:hypothetical protein